MLPCAANGGLLPVPVRPVPVLQGKLEEVSRRRRSEGASAKLSAMAQAAHYRSMAQELQARADAARDAAGRERAELQVGVGATGDPRARKGGEVRGSETFQQRGNGFIVCKGVSMQALPSVPGLLVPAAAATQAQCRPQQGQGPS